ncbi:hypothetical protein BDN70DRAFT_675393 [Pholiota conissans]|uniref:Uncharacterized protein n=1 Tax=Pholiota conissans TaxID=109636 RepID=A0A9P5ZBQ0_9AGAR|nr:hypothetical protein BDN70DRAFT_675393 [Pholiota conissans]
MCSVAFFCCLVSTHRLHYLSFLQVFEFLPHADLPQALESYARCESLILYTDIQNSIHNAMTLTTRTKKLLLFYSHVYLSVKAVTTRTCRNRIGYVGRYCDVTFFVLCWSDGVDFDFVMA